MLLRNYPSLLLFSFFLVSACGVDRAVSTTGGAGGGVFPAGGTGGGDSSPEGVCAYDQIVCDGSLAKVCDGQGGFTKVTQCKGECNAGIGCVECIPNVGVCGANVAKVCDPTGSREVTFACQGPGVSCDPDGCHGSCSPTSLGMSYEGCEFWPTVTANHVWSDPTHIGGENGGFHFGVLLGNVSPGVANVQISGPAESKMCPLRLAKCAGSPSTGFAS